jgi:hypothetical protein
MMSSNTSRSYSGALQFHTFEDRFDYLALSGGVGHSTFGHDRYLNQQFYTSAEWRRARRDVMVRDNGMDLGIDGYPIFSKPTVHHIIPMTPEDFEWGNPLILDLDNLILVSHETHNAIHFGSRVLLKEKFVERRPGDTKMW